MNWNAAVNKKEGCVGFVIIARDCEGLLLGARCMFCPLAVDPTMAATHVVIFSKEVGFFDVIFEGDALQVVREIQSASPHACSFGHFV